MAKTLKRLISFLVAATMCIGIFVLAACSGTQGEKGEKGDSGVQGEQGLPGKDGENGKDGKDGVGIKSAAVNSSGHLILTLTDDTEVDAGKVTSDGSSPSGGVGIKNATVNSEGHLIITLSDDKTIDAGVVKGDKGDQGDKGDKGDQGEKGETGDRGPAGPAGDGSGSVGTMWYTGTETPTAEVEGRDGDFYLNTVAYNLYLRVEGNWVFLCNIGNDNGTGVWDGTIPGWQAPYLTEEEIIKNRPYSYVVDEINKVIEIHNVDAFAWFAYRSVLGTEGYAGWTVKLKCDIDLNNNLWIPIGLGTRAGDNLNAPGVAFKGTFDGEGHTIYNLNGALFHEAIQWGSYRVQTSETEYLEGSGYFIKYTSNGVSADIPLQLVNNTREETVLGYSYGLFAAVEDATIKNLNIEGINIALEKRQASGAPIGEYIEGGSVGAFVGFASGNFTLENCRAGSEGGNDKIGHSSCVGGLVGRIHAGSEENGTSSLDGTYGVINILDCVNYADCGTTGYGEKGGIVGHPAYFEGLNVINCKNYGDIWGYYAGGIIAYRGTGTSPTGGYVTVDNCVNYGQIKSNAFAGGIIAYRDKTSITNSNFFVFKNCSNYGSIVADTVKENVLKDNEIYLGGIAGYLALENADGLFVGCMNYGEIKIDTTQVDNFDKKIIAGGVFGHIYVGGTATITLMCGSCGDISVSWITTKDEGTFKDQELANVKIGIGEADCPNENSVNQVYLVEGGQIKISLINPVG